MKSSTILSAAAVLLTALTFGCNPVEDAALEQNGQPEIAADGPEVHPRPAPQCGPSLYFDLVDLGGSSTAPSTIGGQDYGMVEITNDQNAVWVLPTMGSGWYTSEAHVFAGAPGTLPVANGQVDVSTFPYSTNFSPSRSIGQVQIPMTNLPGTMDISVMVTAHKTDYSSQPTWVRSLWMVATPVANGYYLQGYQFTPCPTAAASNGSCYYIAPGSGACTNIGVNVSGGVAPFTYAWSNGATTAVQNVCPTSSTTYTATVTDANGNSASTEILVCVGGLNCPCAPAETTLTAGSCGGCNSSNSVTFNASSTCVTVSSCKNLSNVVLGYPDCTTFKFDNLTGLTGQFCSPQNQPVSAVWVKSGCNQSGEGPGFGRRFNNPFVSSACTAFSRP